MNESIRSHIISVLKLRPSHLLDSLATETARTLDVDYSDVLRTAHLMADTGELTWVGDPQAGRVRLTAVGELASAPALQRLGGQSLRYLGSHWIAIAALLISLFALFKN